jgi:predicted DsbA family dithiol-disulfide isomerase
MGRQLISLRLRDSGREPDSPVLEPTIALSRSRYIASMRIDVFADIACPWCYVGERRLERALQAHPDLEVDWHWHAFQLQPQMPPRGREWQSFIVEKFGGAQNRDAAFAHVVQAGALEGIGFDFQNMPVAPNTVNAHRLVKLAERHALGQRAAETIFCAYFTEARDVTDPDVLEALGVEIGLEAARVRSFLESDELRQDVFDDQREAERLGITGVPFFVFDQKYALSGAQPLEIFQRALETARSSQTADARLPA